MADRYRTPTGRHATKRQPLIELRNQGNTPSVSQRGSAATTKHVKNNFSNPSLPHNESLEPNGSLAVRSSEQPESSAHKRVSQITNEERDSKRNSAISTTSTNASSRRRKTYIGHWQLGKTIGKGGCSRVRVVRHRYRDQFGAVKIITRSVAESTRAQSLANLIESTRGSSSFTPTGYKPIPYGLEREIAVMKLLEHPNIVRLFDVWENRNELYLIMEYVDGGELFHYVDERKGLPEDETIYVFRQIVSALLYCHRLLICHRDLKPENILLNKHDLTVKLIDFGMAALQPEGRLLSTPCGSPHYAAPEVVSSKPYDGKQADVWSCGVILYVMLTGTTPFNYGEDGDIRLLFRDIGRAHYYMPNGLSLEAKDLIKRIFVTDPRKRITMDGIWEHPLLHKYDKMFRFDGADGTKEAAIGQLPKLEQWKVKRIQDVDREILRNMRTLWHSESEQGLIQKLLNNDINQEKLFYAALVKHREEHLENYVGEPDEISYSASDYHHSRPAIAADAPPLPSDAPRSQSQYSIMNDEHLRASSSFAGPPPSLSSYDPYRASKDPLVDARGDYLNVVVHRSGTTSTRRTSTAGGRLRHPAATRIEQHKREMMYNRSYHNRSASSLTRSGMSRHSMQRSSMSRHSMTSTLLPSSPPVIAKMRPSDVHKRGVSFGHMRRTSTMSALTGQDSSKASTPATPSLPGTLRDRVQRLHSDAKEGPASSPLAHMDQPIKSRKERAAKLNTPRIKVRKPETPSQHMRSEIRKHSAELEKACEEAFFRDSFGSGVTARTSLTDKPSPYDTPPSSISAAPSVTPDLPSMKATPRPLPEFPKDTPNTYLTRTLEETRMKLEAYKSSGDDSSAKFDEVMKMLDTIMPGPHPSEDRRAVTAPDATKAIEQIGALPVISEESSDLRSSREGTNWHRSVTDPVNKTRKHEERTIRVVPPSSPGAIAPLNVRKRSNGSQLSSDDSRRKPTANASLEGMGRKQHDTDVSGLHSIDEDSTLTTPTVVRKKRSGWFGRGKKEDDTEADTTAIDTPRQKPLPTEPPLSAQSSEFPVRKHRFVGGKKGFARWIGRMGREKGLESNMTEGDTTIMTNQSLDSLFSSASQATSSNDAPPAPGPERSWFARFFNIKPAAQVLCFNLGRGRARQELVILLKEWQRHGIRDLQYSRGTNTIAGRVDKRNALDIKPVSFRIELFVVLEHGRKVGLSIARFVQVKGAVSGFRRVLEVVDGVMRGRGWLVEDEEKWRALCEVIGA
ncbi:serine threonine- kinase HSL1 [Lecanosticta acicola]|uniref:non-specific serine/threonine protein kinase n=1 Tax=Lecanosticta acicola TaxID=111012 RepID=A0AAI8Z370_9PEZI|nr:serine threonine- kinase HSL1 [Lecanosticta acicola]